jgi:RHS repeat-associated protein
MTIRAGGRAFELDLGVPLDENEGTRQTVYGEVAYAPYGETYATSGNADFSWTGINADAEPGSPETLYDFPAREYGIQGRWPSPDPLGMGAVNPGDPQSWNRYAYVDNNPLAVTDPTGLCADNIGADCGGVSVNVGGGFFDAIEDFFEFLFGHHSTPHAAPAPPGGYGGGIDPFCGDFVACGASTGIPRIGGGGIPGMGGSSIPWPTNPDGCTYGGGYCGGGAYGFTDGITSGNSNPIWLDGFSINVLVLELSDHSAQSPLKQKLKNLWTRYKPLVKWYVCGETARGGLRAYLLEGAAKGAFIGGIAGGVSGAAAGGIGAVPGSIIGAGGGAVTGASTGAAIGSVVIPACSALGAYN